MFARVREIEETAKKILIDIKETAFSILEFICWPRVAAIT